MADAYDILFGQLDAEEIKKVNRSRNYAQALNLGVRDVYDGFDEVEQEFAARRDTWKAKGHDPFTSFNPDAPKGVDPMTGATARDYAELLYPVVDGVLRTGAAAGANTLGAAYQAAGHMLSTFVDMGEYLSKDLGVPRSELFDKMAKATAARGDQFRKYAQEEGIGPVTNWLTEVLGQAPAGIADFMLNVPFYGTKGAMKAEKAGDNEFVGFLKGALERGLMGQVLHAASTLSRPLRMGITGLVFEEQARHEGITDPDELLKAFATGGLFGVVGGPGKYGTADIRKELGNLEMEARERIRILGEMAPGRILPGERGSNKGEYLGGIESKAKKLLGTTDKLDRAGYITPDGSLLDFSTPSPLRKASYESNRGFTESRFREHDDLPNELGVTPNQFLDSGMVRFAYEPDMTGINVSFNEGQPVSESQFSTIRRAFRTTGEEEIFVDVFPRDDSPPFTESFTSFGDFRKWVDPYLNKPKEPELTMTRALRVGKDIYPIAEGSDHGKTYANIPTSKLVKAGTDVASGWTDQTGKFYLRSEVPWERTTNMRDLTAGEKEKMGEGKAGDDISADLLKKKESIDPVDQLFDVQAGIEAETGKPAIVKKRLWEISKEEAAEILKRGGLDPTLHELAIERAMQQGKSVPIEALRGYFSEGDLLAAEGITGIFAMKEHEMKVWLDMKTDASLIYEHTKGLLTKQQHIDIKHEARRATGQVPASELITMREDQLLRNQLLWEVKAAREAMRKGLKEGQAVGAGRLHKAIELARARADARAEINYMIKNIKTVDPKYMTATTADEVTRLLQDLDLSKLSDKKRVNLENTLDYLSRSPDTELPDYVLDDLARLHKTPIRDLSYDEIRSIHDAVMSLAAQSERVQTLVVKMREQKVQDAVKQAVTEMKDPDLVDQQIISTRPSMMDKFKGLGHWIRQNLGIRQDSFDLIIESISGISSTSYDVLYRRVKQGILTQKMSQQKAESAFRDHLRANKFYETVKDPDKWMNERVTTGRFELSRGERMSLYLHSLNEDNYSAMINGGIGFKNPPPSRGLTPNSVVRITEQEVADISRSLTREEKVMVEAAQKMFREQGVDLANEFYRLNRYRMPPQDNYYPKEVMPLRRGGLDLETEDGLEAFRQFTTRVGIDKSMLIERVGSQRPIYLNDLMTDVNRSVRRATAYIGLEDAMRNASRMLYDTTYKREIIDRYGRDTWVEMEKGLKDIAGSYKAWTSFEKGITKLKTTTVSSALSINPWVWLNQPFSLLTYWSYIEPRYLAKGLTDSITSPKDTLNGLRMYSSELIDRLKTGYDRDVAAVYAAERDKSFYGGKQTLQEKGITPTKYFDLTAVVPGMRAAVYKALDEFQTGELSKPVRDALNVTPEEAVNWTPEQKIAKAHEFADWVTQRTQAQSTPEHRSPLSRGTPLEQMFTAFTSQTNVMLGLVRRTYRDYDRTKDPEALRSMLKAFTSVFVLNAAAMIGIDRLRDLVYGRDSKSIVAGFIDNTASLLYFVRDIERTMSSFIAEGHRGKESSVPAARFAETMKDMAVHIHDLSSDNKKVAEDAQLGVVDSMAQLMSILSGLPYQTPKRLLISATGNNPPPRRKKGEDKDFIDELLED